jgi:site-specific recombinase XerD
MNWPPSRTISPEILPPAGIREAALIAVMYCSGLRREGAAGLDHVDLGRENACLVVHGKRHKDRAVY